MVLWSGFSWDGHLTAYGCFGSSCDDSSSCVGHLIVLWSGSSCDDDSSCDDYLMVLC